MVKFVDIDICRWFLYIVIFASHDIFKFASIEILIYVKMDNSNVENILIGQWKPHFTCKWWLGNDEQMLLSRGDQLCDNISSINENTCILLDHNGVAGKYSQQTQTEFPPPPWTHILINKSS